MNTHAYASPVYSRLDDSTFSRKPRGSAKPTRTQSAVEIVLFGVFGTSIVLALIALYAMFSPAHQLVPNRVDAGMHAGRVNILVIGTSGSGRGTSTRSVTVVSIRPGASQAAMISLPRDLWVRVGHYGSHRLSSAMNIGQSSGYPGEGPGLLSDTVENVIGQPVHAYIRIDMSDLQKTIDALGGIDIASFHEFYERSHKEQFAAGPIHLSGQRALLYAQSTAVRGPQGARYARELRQQEVISALVQKIASASPDVRRQLATSDGIGGASGTNLTFAQVEKLCGHLTHARLKSVTLEPLVSEFEVRTMFEDGEAVRPRSGDFATVRELAANVFAGAQPVAAVH